jgi:hypothetical protein
LKETQLTSQASKETPEAKVPHRLKRRHWKPRSQGLKKEILEAKVPQGLKGDTGSLLSSRLKGDNRSQGP